jgi:hypothetical protein
MWRVVKNMENKIIDIAFELAGQKYTGFVNPSDKLNTNGQPSSFHVVLNNVSFGYLSFSNCRWTVNEDRPPELVRAVGSIIEKNYSL